MAKASLKSGLIRQIALHQGTQKLVPVDLADQATGILVIGDVSGVFSEKIAHDLIDRIVTLFAQGVKNALEDQPHIFLIIAGDSEFYGMFRQNVDLLECLFRYYILFWAGCKGLKTKYFKIIAGLLAVRSPKLQECEIRPVQNRSR